MTQKKKSKAKLTIQEFQTWLEGIMEFQDSDWSPNKEQWVAIYEKIMNLKIETGGTVNISAQSIRDIEAAVNDTMTNIIGDRQNFNRVPSHHAQAPRILEEKDPRLLEAESGGTAYPAQQEIISQEELLQLSQEEINKKIEQAKLYGSSSSAAPIKTKDIDTSNGNYSSDFI